MEEGGSNSVVGDAVADLVDASLYPDSISRTLQMTGGDGLQGFPTHFHSARDFPKPFEDAPSGSPPK
jgi:hypothetical protein